MKKTYNILSLDGGGLRGLITATLLERLESARPGFLAGIDLVAGTSTGGILALALAKGLTPYTIMRMYLTEGTSIFSRSFSRRLGSLFGVTEAKYDNAGLVRALQAVFGDSTLASLSKKVAITAFDLGEGVNENRTWCPKIFHNYLGDDSDGDELALNVALRTSAAPTYFPSVDGYIDGGVFANNPSMVALAQALDARSDEPDGQSRDLANIRLLSVGTGTNLRHINGQRLDWGFAKWAEPLLNILMDGVSGTADFQCKQLLRDNYCRLQLDFPAGTSIPMDSVDDLGKMLHLAQTASISPAARWLESSGWTASNLQKPGK
jgi:patatin-like phospholipase/acyl hydrolase